MRSILSISILFVALIILSCEEENLGVSCSEGVEATLRDLSGLNGCGFVFVLDDGTKLEPQITMLYCGTPPLPKEVTKDPLYQFEWVDGTRVKIGYKELEGYASICMVGAQVKITCIEVLDEPTPQD